MCRLQFVHVQLRAYKIPYLVSRLIGWWGYRVSRIAVNPSVGATQRHPCR